MTRLFALLFALAVAAMGVATAGAVSPTTPTAPAHLAQHVNDHGVAPAAWVRSNKITLSMQAVGTGGWLHAEVEVAHAGTPFTGTATLRGPGQQIPAGSATALTATVSGLSDGSYVWQARVVDGHGDASAWVPFVSSGPAVQIDTTPPSRPQISSSTNPRWGAWYRSKTETFQWSATDSGSGIAGYSYALTQSGHASRPPWSSTTSTTFHHTGNGKWIMHVWARDVAGNWSNLGTYKFNVLHKAPRIRFKGLGTSHFNPYEGKEVWYFSLNRRADTTVEVARTGKKKPILVVHLGHLKAGHHEFEWNGKNRHQWMVGKGWFWIRILTTDKLGNQGSFASHGIWVVPFKPSLPFVSESGHHIVISLSKEALYAYDGNKLVWQSLVTTGNPALPTPTGHFSIFAKYSPFEFVSPWPPGSPYWYAPSWTSYAMEFISGGYFIHDAPWRTVFGPGSDGPGQPGTNYGGTHGCVNVPLDTARFLYGWTSIGTTVDVIN